METLPTKIEPSVEIQTSDGPRRILGYDQDQLSVIRLLFPKGLNLSDFRIFCAAARATGLNPVNREIYAIPYKGQMVLQTGIDGYRKIANRQGRFRGVINPRLLVKTECGETMTVAHEHYDPDDHIKIISGSIDILVEGFDHPVSATAMMRSYCKTANGEPTNLWKSMPEVMILKCAEALAYRKSGLFAGVDAPPVYVDAEMQQAGSIEIDFHGVSKQEPEQSTLSPDDLKPGEPEDHTDVKGTIVQPDGTGKMGACETYWITTIDALQSKYSLTENAMKRIKALCDEHSIDPAAMSDRSKKALETWIWKTLVPELQKEEWLPEGDITL
jgi:phage recombination protein Bet